MSSSRTNKACKMHLVKFESYIEEAVGNGDVTTFLRSIDNLVNAVVEKITIIEKSAADTRIKAADILHWTYRRKNQNIDIINDPNAVVKAIVSALTNDLKRKMIDAGNQIAHYISNKELSENKISGIYKNAKQSVLASFQNSGTIVRDFLNYVNRNVSDNF